MGDFQREDKSDRTIFARNISWNATVDDLFQVEQFKSAVDIKIPTDRETGRPRGFGFIEFATPEDCQQALANSQGLVIDQRELILAQSQPRGAQGGGRGGFQGGRGGGGGGFRGGRGGYGGQQQQGGYGGQQQGGYGGQQQQGGYGGQQQGGW